MRFKKPKPFGKKKKEKKTMTPEQRLFVLLAALLRRTTECSPDSPPCSVGTAVSAEELVYTVQNFEFKIGADKENNRWILELAPLPGSMTFTQFKDMLERAKAENAEPLIYMPPSSEKVQ